MFRYVVLVLLLWKISTVIYIFLGPLVLPLRSGYLANDRFGFGYPAVVWSLGNFDGMHYLAIAERGYQLLEQPFFPLYPFCIAFFRKLTGIPLLLSALSISHIALFGALFVCWKLLALDARLSMGKLFFAVLLFYPTAYHYGAVYNDALFFFFSCLTLYWGRKGNFLFASISGAAAVLTRLNGIALALYLVTEYLLQIVQEGHMLLFSKQLLVSAAKGLSWTTHSIGWVIFLPLSYIGYLYYIHSTFGDWHLLHTTMKIWGQDAVVFPLQTMWRYYTILAVYDFHQMNYWVAFFELCFVIFYAGVAVYGYKKIRFSYWVALVCSLSIPAFTGSFQGMPRYALHHYGFFLILAHWLYEKKSLVKIIYFIGSILLFGWFILQFSRGYFVT